MADIFISYARADRARIERLAAALEAEGWSVWWDRNIVGGSEFSAEIERELNAASAVVVAWSDDALKSTWVKDEALTARDQGKLIPVSLDGVAAPMGFKQFHLIDLEDWNGEAAAPEFQDLARTVTARLTGTAPAPASPATKKDTLFRKLNKPEKGKDSPLMTLAKGAVVIGIVFVVLKYARPNSSDDSRPPPAPTQTAQPLQTQPVAQADRRARPAGDAQGAPEGASPGSIAVLPFADLSPEGDQEYFADGIAEEILNVLAGVDGLDVASRTSSFQFRRQGAIGAPAIARELGVRHVLQGSVRKSGDAIRITAQLIDATSDTHLWSDAFDRTLTAQNIFAIQDEISNSIVTALAPSLTDADRREIAVTGDTDSADAYALYLNGYGRFLRRGADNVAASIAYFERAVAADPDFARAWASLAAAYVVAPSWDIKDRDYETLAEQSARTALRLDPDLSLAYSALGYREKYFSNQNYAAALDYFGKAIEKDPNDPTAYFWRSEANLNLGYFDRALADLEACIAIEPLYANCHRNRWQLAISEGRSERARALLAEGFRKGLVQTFLPLEILHYADIGDDAALLIALRDWVKFGLGDDGAWAIDLLYRAITDENFDRAAGIKTFDARLAALGVAVHGNTNFINGSNFLLGAYDRVLNRATPWHWHPILSKAENRDAHKAMMRRFGLVDHWRAHGWPAQCRPTAAAGGAEDFECN